MCVCMCILARDLLGICWTGYTDIYIERERQREIERQPGRDKEGHINEYICVHACVYAYICVCIIHAYT